MKKILLVLFFLGWSQSYAASDLPVLNIKTLEGKDFDLEQKRGKVVIVNFWATWCVDCRKEMLILDELYKKYKGQGLEIIGVSTDRKKYREDVSNIVSELKYAQAMFYEAQKTSFDEPKVVPMNYVIGKKGKLRATLIADKRPLNKADFEEVIKPLLAQK